MARPQVNTDLGRAEVQRVTARPTGDRATPSAVGTSRAGQLAQALSGIAPTLNGYLEEFKQDHIQSEENRAYDTIQGMTYDEAQAAVKSGAMRQTESPFYQAAFEKQFGVVYANRRKREMLDAYNNSFDKHNGNIDEFAASWAAEDMDKFGGSEFIMSGYRKSMAGALQNLRDSHAEWKSSWTQNAAYEQFGTAVYDNVVTTIEEGGDLQAMLNTLKGESRQTLGFTFKQMDEQIFAAAERLASEGNLNAVEQLLSQETVGPDGTVIGSYLTRSSHATRAAELLEIAKATKGKADRAENVETMVNVRTSATAGNLDLALLDQLVENGQVSPQQAETYRVQNQQAMAGRAIAAQNEAQLDAIKTQASDLISNGQAYAIQDFSYVNAQGKTVTVSRDKLVKDTVTDHMNTLAAQQVDPRVMAAELASYGVDVTYGPWQELLTNGLNALSPELAVGADGQVEIPETALNAFATYKALSEQPRLRDKHMDGASGEVFATAQMLEEMGFSPEDALLQANSPASEAGEAASNNFSRAEFEDLANTLNTGWFNEDISNGADVLGRTEALAKFYISRGVPKDKAVERAIEDYESSYTTINGFSVNTRNVHLPENFEDASLVSLQEFAEESGEDVDDLTLVPVGNGSNFWYVAYKGNVAMPVPGATSNRIHTSQIEATHRGIVEMIEEVDLEGLAETVGQSAAEAAAFDDAMERRRENRNRRALRGNE